MDGCCFFPQYLTLSLAIINAIRVRSKDIVGCSTHRVKNFCRAAPRRLRNSGVKWSFWTRRAKVCFSGRGCRRETKQREVKAHWIPKKSAARTTGTQRSCAWDLTHVYKKQSGLWKKDATVEQRTSTFYYVLLVHAWIATAHRNKVSGQQTLI